MKLRYAQPPKYIIPIAAVSLLVLLLVSIIVFWRVAIKSGDTIIAQDIELLKKVFHQIDDDTSIIDFEHERNYIDFLTVVKFVGSEVGAVNLAKPENWKGPYLHDNPTYQEKYYEIIKTKKGHYIVPGYGIELSSGKVIGKDIMYDENADMEKLIQSDGALNYRGTPLGAHFKLNSETVLELPVSTPVNLDVG